MLGAAYLAIAQNHVTGQSLVEQCPSPKGRRKAGIARLSIAEIELLEGGFMI